MTKLVSKEVRVRDFPPLYERVLIEIDEAGQERLEFVGKSLGDDTIHHIAERNGSIIIHKS